MPKKENPLETRFLNAYGKVSLYHAFALHGWDLLWNSIEAGEWNLKRQAPEKSSIMLHLISFGHSTFLILSCLSGFYSHLRVKLSLSAMNWKEN